MPSPKRAEKGTTIRVSDPVAEILRQIAALEKSTPSEVLDSLVPHLKERLKAAAKTLGEK